MATVGGLSYEDIPAAERGNKPWKYRVVQPYHYRWLRTPILDSKWTGSQLVATIGSGIPVAGLTIQPTDGRDEHSVTLLPGYAWDGSSGPGVADTKECMRASALHDVWCQAMRLDGMYKNSFPNWCRGALEYRSVCIEDGMLWSRASMRLTGLIAKGGVDAGVRGAKAVGTGVAKGAKAVGHRAASGAKAVGTGVVNGAKALGRFFIGLFTAHR